MQYVLLMYYLSANVTHMPAVALESVAQTLCKQNGSTPTHSTTLRRKAAQEVRAAYLWRQALTCQCMTHGGLLCLVGTDLVVEVNEAHPHGLYVIVQD